MRPLIFKGRWVLDLLQRTVDRSISFRDSIRFAAVRFQPKPVSFTLNQIRFDNADHLVWSLASEIFLGRHYCPEGFEIEPGDTVLDVGAHKGVFTAYAATKTRNKIHAYEPNLSNFSCLKTLITSNGWNNVVPINKAMSSQQGYIKLFRSEMSTRHNLTGKDPVTGQPLREYDLVPAATLEEAIGPFEHIDFMKMDCEGAEVPILLSSGVAFQKIRRIALEFHFMTDTEITQKLTSHLRKYYQSIEFRPGYQPSLGYLFASDLRY
jgi:FkbM family methyltransferase